MSAQAISQELGRVRKLKRALESEVEFLRSDMENGKLHIRINPDIKSYLAECLVQIYQLGYDSNIHTNYYTDGEQIYKEMPNRNWNSWSENINFKVIPVQNILEGSTQKYYAWDEFDSQTLKDCIDEKYFQEMQQNENYDNNILYFLQEEYPDVYDEFVEQQQEIALEFFFNEIPDEYTVETTQ